MPMSAETFELKSLNSPEEVRKFDNGKVELVNVAGAAVGRATFEPGWKWSTCVKPIAKTNSCQAAHYGYQLSGTMTTRMDDGTWDGWTKNRQSLDGAAAPRSPRSKQEPRPYLDLSGGSGRGERAVVGPLSALAERQDDARLG